MTNTPKLSLIFVVWNLSQSIKIFFQKMQSILSSNLLFISVFHIGVEKTMHFKFNLGVLILSKSQLKKYWLYLSTYRDKLSLAKKLQQKPPLDEWTTEIGSLSHS